MADQVNPPAVFAAVLLLYWVKLRQFPSPARYDRSPRQSYRGFSRSLCFGKASVNGFWSPIERYLLAESGRIGFYDRHTRLAAAVEWALQGDEEIVTVCANPLTSTVLVHYGPNLVPDSIAILIRRAGELGRVNLADFSSLRSKRRSHLSFRGLLAAEIGCSAFKFVLLGSGCPLVLGAAGLLVFLRPHA